MIDQEQMIKVTIEPIFGIEEEYLVWFFRSINERSFAGIADLEKLKAELLTFVQYKKFNKNEVNSFDIKKERLLNSFEDVFL